MTLKHISPSESVVIRSLEQVAHQKGWFKDKPIKKQASAEKPDFSPTENFDVDVTKLASALRSTGFETYASNLEEKFLNYKSAKVNLYMAHKETGEDLINEAHPEGDAHMADASEERGDVETTLSRHKKIVDIVNKEPTGKLSSAQDIIDQVKLALGVDSSFLVGRKDQGQITGFVATAATPIGVPDMRSLAPRELDRYLLEVEKDLIGKGTARSEIETYLAKLQKAWNDDPSLWRRFKSLFKSDPAKAFEEAETVASRAAPAAEQAVVRVAPEAATLVSVTAPTAAPAAGSFEMFVAALVSTPVLLATAIAGIGVIITMLYYKNKFVTEELSEAISNLSSELSDVKDTDEYTKLSAHFEALKKDKEAYDTYFNSLEHASDDKSVGSLKAVSKVYDAALDMMSQANSIWQTADQMANKSTRTDLAVWKTRASQFADVAIVASNVVRLISQKFMPNAIEAKQKIEDEINSHMTSTPDKTFNDLISGLNSVLSVIDKLEQKVQSKQQSDTQDKQTAIDWLQGVKNQAQSYMNEFSGEAYTVKQKSLPKFQEAVKSIMKDLTDLNSLVSKWV